MNLPAFSAPFHQKIFHTIKGLVYLTGSKMTQIRTLKHLNPHSMRGNLMLRILTDPKVWLILSLTLQTSATTVAMNLTPNLVAQMALEILAILAD